MSSCESEEDLVVYGTPLEPLEEDEIPNKRVRLVEDQVVTDKQGRRRFHGAFTGGFSAGYFNTVGSLEGWTPSSFKSSKSKKQETFQQRPEDFMDEEDMSEFGIAPVILKARQDYTNERKKEIPAFSEFGALGTFVLQNVLRHVRETVGIKLLKKMGWKPGQGVGPRLKKHEKQYSLKRRQKMYGCQLPPGVFQQEEEEDEDINSDSEWNDIEFAPNDYEPFLCEAKNNFSGLGYEGLDKKPVLSGNSTSKVKGDFGKQHKPGFSSQAFGVGAFEEEDDDVYEKDDMSHYNFFLGKDESTNENKSTEEICPVTDGVLEGFSLETKPSVKKHYPLPKLPKDFKPHHKVRHSRFDNPPTDVREKVSKGFKVNFEDRREILEKFSEDVENAKKEREKMVKSEISDVRVNESKFKPFSSNREKQERYENYLKLIKIGKRELLSDLQPLSMTSWDKEKERFEFEKAALLFRPLTGEMEDRFSTASQPDDLSDPLAVVEKYVDENDDRRKAAKMKMFGAMTRTTDGWSPAPLLCKRFNVPEPKNSSAQSEEKQKRKSHFNLFESVQNLKEDAEKEQSGDASAEKSTEGEVETSESADKSPSTNESKTDLFKAIFLDSDDEEEVPREEKEKEKFSGGDSNKTPEKVDFQEDIPYEDKLINSKRNSSPPKGIFECIDLELFSSARKVDHPVEEPLKNRQTESKAIAEQVSVPFNLVYGPRIPERIPPKTDFSTGESKDDGIWVEKKKHVGKKHKKKEKKNKKSSHKSKHKHKRKK